MFFLTSELQQIKTIPNNLYAVTTRPYDAKSVSIALFMRLSEGRTASDAYNRKGNGLQPVV